MSVVSLLGVKVLNNPAPFDAKYQFEITFECLEPLQKGNFAMTLSHLLQRLTYVLRPRMEAYICRICYIVRDRSPVVAVG